MKPEGAHPDDRAFDLLLLKCVKDALPPQYSVECRSMQHKFEICVLREGKAASVVVPRPVAVSAPVWLIVYVIVREINAVWKASHEAS